MADGASDPKRGMGWIWALIAILVIALLAWWFMTRGGVQEEPELAGPVEDPTVAEETRVTTRDVTGTADQRVVAILDNPVPWRGQPLTGEWPVAEVVTDRTFWIEEEGTRILVVLDPYPDGARPIEPGTRVRLSDATVRTSEDLAVLAGELDEESRQLAAEQTAFLTVPPGSVETTAGTADG